MKGPEGPDKNSKQPQNESEADFHSREVTGFEMGGNGGVSKHQCFKAVPTA